MKIKFILIVSLFLMLSACASFRSNEDRAEECEKLGFAKTSKDNSLCVLLLIERDRQEDQRTLALLHGGNPSQPSNIGSASSSSNFGTPVYNASECIGPIINGECHGSILPNTAYHPTCHGTMLNGQCTGPLF